MENVSQSIRLSPPEYTVFPNVSCPLASEGERWSEKIKLKLIINFRRVSTPVALKGSLSLT